MTDLVDVRDLSIEFHTRGLTIRALDRVSFRIAPGTTLALVGESGSGKSITAQAMMRILPPSASITSGQIVFDGVPEHSEVDALVLMTEPIADAADVPPW